MPATEILPYGGAELWIPGAAGGGLIALGLALRRRLRFVPLAGWTGKALVRRASFLMSASRAAIVGGILPLIGALGWVGYTGGVVAPAQTAALVAWEEQIPPAVGATDEAGVPAGLVLSIPRLGFRRFVPEGATPDQLRRFGLGRITWTSRPGHDGILGIAGHRTTYGAPFFRLNTLRPGDVVLVDHSGTRYRYVVKRTVETTPERTDLLEGDQGRQGIALITCTPVYSAARRLVVLGALEQTASLPRQ